MRTLFFGTPGSGHLIPQIPLARAMRERSHAVAFVSAASTAGLLGRESFDLLPVGPEIPAIVEEVARTTGINLWETAANTNPERESALFATRIDLGYLDSLVAARDWKPDLIVSEVCDLIGPMVGAQLGVPVAELAFGPAFVPEIGEAMTAGAKARHERFGLHVEPARWFLDTCPPSLQFDDWRAPAGRIGLRPEAYSGGLPPVAGEEKPGLERRRPRILVSFGTIFVIPEVITPIVRELLNQDLDIRVTLGPDRKPEEFDLESDRVEFVGFTPLARLLSDVDVVLTVGGAGTILGALSLGIPLVMTPLGADQPTHSRHAEAAGAGIAFKVGEAEPRAVAEAVSTVLAEPAYRQAARSVAAEIAAMLSPGEVAEKLASDIS